jgi:class 3 adenylate cyclase
MHAFLFADLRGYTQFAATRGDRAAAELLTRYRSLVREEIGRHAGAEIRTEGDSFYVVFPSVSAAVGCALAIATAARDATAADPSLPLSVGMGVHFGETVDTAEGSVGSAVNLAARLAAAAGPNEVLVSDVVRSLTRTLPDVRTTNVGSRRLKGFAEPVPVYRASASGEIPVPGRIRVRAGPLSLPVLVAGVLVAAAVLGAVAWVTAGGLWGLVGSTATPAATQLAQTASPSPSAGGDRAFTEGLLDAGTYVDRDFVPNVRIELTEQWCSGLPTVRRITTKTGPDLFYMYQPGADILQDVAGDACASSQRQPDAGFLSLNRVTQVYGPTACDDGVTRSIASWDALVDYLASLPGTTVSNRASASFGGVLGVGFDLHVDAGMVCPESGAPTRAVLAFPTTTIDRAQYHARVAPVWWAEGQYIRLWVVDVDGQLIVGSIGHELSTEPVSRDFIDKAYRVIQTLRFLPVG